MGEITFYEEMLDIYVSMNLFSNEIFYDEGKSLIYEMLSKMNGLIETFSL